MRVWGFVFDHERLEKSSLWKSGDCVFVSFAGVSPERSGEYEVRSLAGIELI